MGASTSRQLKIKLEDVKSEKSLKGNPRSAFEIFDGQGGKEDIFKDNIPDFPYMKTRL